jgi:hypothetical protein
LIIWQLSVDVGLLLLLNHYLLHSKILYAQHTTHQLIFTEGGKPDWLLVVVKKMVLQAD